MQLKQGMIVKSDAGHDQQRYYVIVSIDDSYAYIADGKRRKLEKPKRKNFCHINKTNIILDKTEYQTNHKIRRVLHKYNYLSSSVAD